LVDTGTEASITHKRCRDCGQVKAVDRFYRRRETAGTRKSDWLSYCKGCYKGRRYPRLRATANRRLQLQRYGLTLAAYEALLLGQAGLCAICRQTETATYRGRVKRLSVDHDHATGRVRGLLCHNCNVMLAGSRDNPTFLQGAIAYLAST